MKISEAKELRGFILSMCKVNYPHGCSEQLVQITVSENDFAASPALLAGHFEYLEEKGYVRVEEARNDKLGISRRMIYITAKGIDLLEGNIPPDPGILLPVWSD